MTRVHRFALLALVLVLGACGADAPAPTSGADTPSLAPASVASALPSAPIVGEPEPAPGSDSTVYEPNPAAIVVAIDPGHGGCLDWGVPDPSERGVEWSEKQLTLEVPAGQASFKRSRGRQVRAPHRLAAPAPS